MNSNSLLSPRSCCTQLLLDAKRSLMVVTHRGPAVLWCLPPFIWIKSAGWKCQRAARFPSRVLSSLCELSTAAPANTPQRVEGRDSAPRLRHPSVSISVQSGCLIQLPKCNTWHERCCRLSIGSPCYKGASLPWSTVLMQTPLGPLQADPLHLRHPKCF